MYVEDLRDERSKKHHLKLKDPSASSR